MNKNLKSDDLVVVKFLKEVKSLKKQLQLIKNNMDYVSMEDLLKVLTISKALNKEFDELKSNSKVELDKDGSWSGCLLWDIDLCSFSQEDL